MQGSFEPYQAGIPTQSSSQATMVGPFQRAKGVPAFIASSRSSCLCVKLKKSILESKLKSIMGTYFFFFLLSKSPLPARPPRPPMLSLGTISGSPGWLGYPECWDPDIGVVTKPPEVLVFKPLSFFPKIRPREDFSPFFFAAAAAADARSCARSCAA